MNNIWVPGTLRRDLRGLDPVSPIEEVPAPEVIMLPLLRHRGIDSRRLIEPGEQLFKGERVSTHPDAAITAMHASISGRFTELRPHRFSEYGMMECMVIESNGDETMKSDLRPIVSPWDGEPQTLRRVVLDAGVPLPWVAWTDPDAAPPEPARVVINGIQEGFSGGVTRRLLLSHPQQLVDGARILCRLFSVDEVTLAGDEKTADWWEAVQRADRHHVVRFQSVTSTYPAGHPSLLCAALFGSEARDPRERGISVVSVPSALQIADAVLNGHPVIHAFLTVCGPGIATAKHLKVRLGTPIENVIEHCGGFRGTPTRMVLGTPLDGMPQYALDRPILKDAHWLWVTNRRDRDRATYRPCINCGDCVDVCPMRLLPNMLGKLCEFDRFDEAATRYDLETCIDCGLCSYVCPARRPLVQFINHGKREQLHEAEHHGRE